MATRFLVKIQGLDADLDFTGSFEPLTPGEVPRSRVEWLLRRVRESPSARSDRECPARLEVESHDGGLLQFQGEEGYLFLVEGGSLRDIPLSEAMERITGTPPRDLPSSIVSPPVLPAAPRVSPGDRVGALPPVPEDPAPPPPPPVPEPVYVAEPVPDPEAEAEAEAEVLPEEPPEPSPPAEPRIEPVAEPLPQADPVPPAEAAVDPEPAAEVRAEPAAEIEAEPAAEDIGNPETEIEAGPTSELAAEPPGDPALEAARELTPEPGPAPESESALEPKPAPEPEPEPELTPDPEPAPAATEIPLPEPPVAPEPEPEATASPLPEPPVEPEPEPEATASPLPEPPVEPEPETPAPPPPEAPAPPPRPRREVVPAESWPPVPGSEPESGEPESGPPDQPPEESPEPTIPAPPVIPEASLPRPPPRKRAPRGRTHVVELRLRPGLWRPGLFPRFLGLLGILACGYAIQAILLHSPPGTWETWRDAPLPLPGMEALVTPRDPAPPPLPEETPPPTDPHPESSPEPGTAPPQPASPVPDAPPPPTSSEEEELSFELANLPKQARTGDRPSVDLTLRGGEGPYQIHLFGSLLEAPQDLVFPEAGVHPLPLVLARTPGKLYLKVKVEGARQKAFQQFPVEVFAPFQASLVTCQEGLVGSSCDFEVRVEGGAPPYWGSVRAPGGKVEIPYSDRLVATGSFLLPEEPGEIRVSAAMLDGRDDTSTARVLVQVLPAPEETPEPAPEPTPEPSTAPEPGPDAAELARLSRCEELARERQEARDALARKSSLGRRDSLGGLSLDLAQLRAREAREKEWAELGCEEGP